MAFYDSLAVADLLDELGDRLELTGESAFKVRAYHRAADVLRALKTPLETLVAAGKLKSLPGVGEAIAEKITSFHKRGLHPTLDRLREEVPDGLLELTRVAGLGPKRVLQLRAELGVESLDALEAAARSGKLSDVKGFGGKTEARLLESIGFVRTCAGRLRLPEADLALEAARAAVAGLAGFKSAHPAGEARRRCETVSDPCLVIATTDPGALPPRAGPGHAVRLIPAPPARLGAALLAATGSPAHLERLKARASERGLRLDADGLYRDGQALETPGEGDALERLGLPFIEPELREDRGEIEAALKGSLPRLISPAEIRGILHAHTTFSDGAHSLDEMAEAVRALGLEYFGVADHSQSAAYAGGLKEDRVRRQHEEIDRLNERYAKEGQKFRVFKGIESDIREDGSLDYTDEVLARFDFVVASVHSRFELDREVQTARVVRAVSHPAATILGHPTGRLLLRREGYAVDLERVIAACAQHGVAIEINAHPVRLDLDWRWLARAKTAGAKLSVDPDSHNSVELVHYRYGVEMARKGGLGPEDNLTCLGADALAAHFLARKQRKPAASGQ